MLYLARDRYLINANTSGPSCQPQEQAPPSLARRGSQGREKPSKAKILSLLRSFCSTTAHHCFIQKLYRMLTWI